MKIILLENVVNLGQLGDVVTVANGYARNFLIPFSKAKRATELNMKEFEVKRKDYEARQAQIVESAKGKLEKLNGQAFTISAKAGVDGKLFGSVTSFDIVAAVGTSGIEIHKSEVRLPNGPLKTIGEFDIEVALYHDVRASIKVNVTPEA